MEWVDKMDLVLGKLYTESGDAPTMKKLEEWLAKKDIHIGEIQDITLHLYKEKYIYCCDASGDRNAKYFDDGIFLISCAGKLFWENEKGFRVYFKKLAAANEGRERNEARLTTWTKRLTVATYVAASLIVGWEIIKTFWIEHSCR